MPNHEENYVVIIGEPDKITAFVAEALRDVTAEEVEKYPTMPAKIIEFGRVIPMPEELGRTVAPSEIVATQADADAKNAEYNSSEINRLFGGDREDQIRFITRDEHDRRMREYGAVDWYAWSTANWGTKWGAYSHTHYRLQWLRPDTEAATYGRVELHFQTAWSQPRPIFEAIEKRWGVTVLAVTQDEGGFPDEFYPDEDAVKNAEVLSRTVIYEFECWDSEVEVTA